MRRPGRGARAARRRARRASTASPCSRRAPTSCCSARRDDGHALWERWSSTGCSSATSRAGPGSRTACGSRSARPRRTTPSSPRSRGAPEVARRDESDEPDARIRAARAPRRRPTSSVDLDVDGHGTRRRRPASRSSTTCSSSSASTAASTCGSWRGRPRGRPPPHGRGRRHRARHRVQGRARRQGRRAAVRVGAGAARRGAGAGGARPVGPPVPRLRGRPGRRSGSARSTRSSPRSSGGRSRSAPASRCTSARSPAATATTSSRRRSRASPGACATRCGSRAPACRRPRARSEPRPVDLFPPSTSAAGSASGCAGATSPPRPSTTTIRSRVAREFEAPGARWIHVVDLDAARTGTRRPPRPDPPIVARRRCRVQVGGGVRSVEAARELLDAGVDGSWSAPPRSSARSSSRSCAGIPGRVAVGLDARAARSRSAAGWRAPVTTWSSSRAVRRRRGRRADRHRDRPRRHPRGPGLDQLGAVLAAPRSRWSRAAASARSTICARSHGSGPATARWRARSSAARSTRGGSPSPRRWRHSRGRERLTVGAIRSGGTQHHDRPQGPRRRGSRWRTGDVIDEGFLRRYRELLDAEDAAFDELEHAYEEGDRAHCDADLAAWRQIVEKRCAFLETAGHHARHRRLTR